MEAYLIPSVTAICFKIAIFLRYQESLRKENFNLCLLFFAVLLLNIFELINLERTYDQSTTLLLLVTYYCCAVFIVHAYINIAIEYARFSWNVRVIKTSLNILLAVMTVALIFDRGIVAGWERGMFGYIPTKIEGVRYWIFQLYALGGMAFALGLLIRGSRKLHSNLQRRQCLVFLFASLTPVLITTMVLVLQAQGIPVSSGIFMSLAFTVMLGIMVYAEEKTRLFRLLTLVPYSAERKLHHQLLSNITKCIAISDAPGGNENLNLKQMMKSLESTVVEHVLQYYEGNQKLAASALGVSEATISRRARAVITGSDFDSDSQSAAQDSIRITQ